MSWNIEGLSAKLSEPGFMTYICSFDICSFVETFTSPSFDFDIYFRNYVVFHCPAVKLSYQGRRSGGVITLVKKSLADYVHPLPCYHDNMIVLRFGNIAQVDFILVSVYIPPVDSHYYRDKEIKCNLYFLEEMLLDIQET